MVSRRLERSCATPSGAYVLHRDVVDAELACVETDNADWDAVRATRRGGQTPGCPLPHRGCGDGGTVLPRAPASADIAKGDAERDRRVALVVDRQLVRRRRVDGDRAATRVAVRGNRRDAMFVVRMPSSCSAAVPSEASVIRAHAADLSPGSPRCQQRGDAAGPSSNEPFGAKLGTGGAVAGAAETLGSSGPPVISETVRTTVPRSGRPSSAAARGGRRSAWCRRSVWRGDRRREGTRRGLQRRASRTRSRRRSPPAAWSRRSSRQDTRRRGVRARAPTAARDHRRSVTSARPGLGQATRGDASCVRRSRGPRERDPGPAAPTCGTERNPGFPRRTLLTKTVACMP